PTEVALYLLNEKRETLATMETNRHVRLRVSASSNLTPPDFELNVAASFEEEELAAEARAPAPHREVEAIEEDLIEADEPEEEEDEDVQTPAASADAESE